MWFLAPPKHCDRLPCGRGGRVDVVGDIGAADETDGFDVGVVQDRVDSLLIAMHDLEYAGRQTGLEEQLDQTAAEPTDPAHLA